MNHFARAQFNYDNALPTDSSKRDALVAARSDQLANDMWQDLEYLTDAVNDAIIQIGYYRRKGMSIHPKAVTWLTLLRDGSDDIELARMLREASRNSIDQLARDMAEEEIHEPPID